ncbi:MULTISPECIES: alpha/beta fold hydrolase [Bradyrhizobium]|uniref:alpha/beta fold hydrolase n=1 Tax=Bradyrhizobium TaxID=374 RepID=UPI001449CD95|nr:MULTISPECIES: alpha/beta hydrolase [Bradyrhizobium]MCP1924708.1 2-hydroxy-6-oxonona-2,4-dienedioate hydrolase [Bradyrhizobium elkanii]MCS3584532.1 2-hydroxy-6-oxonona-2,4-dienedioate hydrolase [Bradyrhizobium elkanii]MCS3718112.1 2-hydroxy-6-oxonona-2,4-dienedioate hydrolase [Bradyrhizobium elkanii]MCS4011820.1 2-hydroxy-6-oxonona-2,4-dienedioate hydrolase [Bradyrhizobium elkanii USDA 61]BBB97679.1 2-hydroxy-6-ketonona-2,4-dienedioic acid hydrolase [Bradyrhizobium elkanii USDA 61]
MTMQITPLESAETSRYVSIDGRRVHYNALEHAGSANTPVIFTHGGGPGATSWNNFLYNAREFSGRYNCYFYDLPGFGASESVPISGPVHSWYAEQFLKFMDALKIDRAHLVNQSYGGAMAIKVAASAPTRVDHLVITGSRPIIGGLTAPASALRGKKALQRYYAAAEGPTMDQMRSLLADLEFYDPDRITDLNVKLRFEMSITPNVREFISQPTKRGQPESLFEDFRKVTARTLIVHGLHDAFGGVDVPLTMVNQFADARLHLVGHAGHHVQTECPAEYNAVVLGFLS